MLNCRSMSVHLGFGAKLAKTMTTYVEYRQIEQTHFIYEWSHIIS